MVIIHMGLHGSIIFKFCVTLRASILTFCIEAFIVKTFVGVFFLITFITFISIILMVVIHIGLQESIASSINQTTFPI